MAMNEGQVSQSENDDRLKARGKSLQESRTPLPRILRNPSESLRIFVNLENL